MKKKLFGRMLRFENLNHPLLVKFSNEAPGTYSHSLAVAELACRGAKSIGLDAPFLRLGGYFHDIGKLKSPKIFVENQKSETWIEDKELAKKSRAIIDHVLFGQKLARNYNLPDEVIEYIGEHHGSSEIFSLRRRLEKAHLNAHYPGPKPLSKPAAILMLSDSIEARTRGLKILSDEKIIQGVETEFRKKISEGQLDLSGLTVQEIKKLKDSFAQNIIAQKHKRKIGRK